MDYPVIELAIQPRQVEIWYQKRCYLRLSVTQDNVLAVAAPRFDEIDWTEEAIILSAKQIDVFTLIRETLPEGSVVAMPRVRREKAAEGVVRAPRAARATATEAVNRFDDHTKDQIVAAALDLRIETQQKATALQIVARLGLDDIDKMPVAGVLAALTKGFYGNPETLLTQRRRFRSRNASTTAGA